MEETLLEEVVPALLAAAEVVAVVGASGDDMAECPICMDPRARGKWCCST